MDIEGFDISNFKGIREAKIRLAEYGTARVHTLVGLNESGKTTLLEALHSFSPDAETQLVVRNLTTIEQQRERWVPRDKISNFTGDVSITAHVVATDTDWQAVCDRFTAATDLICETTELPQRFTARRVHRYSNGDFVESKLLLHAKVPRVRTKRAAIFREADGNKAQLFRTLTWEALPTVAYYPTFVFDFPERIYLTTRDKSARNRFYRQIFQDILDYDGNGLTIADSILARMNKVENPWHAWFPWFSGDSEEEKVNQVVGRAGIAATKLIFSRWNEVFNELVGNKEIVIEVKYEEGRGEKREDGSEEEATRHDAYIRFRIKDGASSYSVDDRSLGFRWFFAFLLFTQLRVYRETDRPTIFLFDEPASNLHAAAQKKLLESFPAIARAPHRLIYSTHSHYMVDPRWLEQAYIVFDGTNRADTAIIEQAVRSDSGVDIQVVPYRRFVAENPSETSYFQPILDTLEVQPSHFDYRTGGLIVEGKGDYYFLKFAAMMLNQQIGPIFPGTGSGALGALVALHRGWGLPVRVLFDSDQGGSDGRRNLKSDLLLTEHETTNVGKLSTACLRMPDIFSPADVKKLGGPAGPQQKSTLLRRVQELLAAEQRPELTKETLERMGGILAGLERFLSNDPLSPTSV